MRRKAALWAVLLGLPLALGCDGTVVRPEPPTEPAEVYWDLNLDHHAVTLSTTAPYNTQTVVATPRNYQGETLADLPAPTYTSPDPTRVLVTPEGQLVAVAPTSTTVKVVASLTVGNLRHTDTVYVKVVNNPTPPVLGSLSIHPVPPDSAKFAMSADLSTFPAAKLIPARATDTNGAPISDLLVWFRVSDPVMAKVDPTTGNLTPGYTPGTVAIYASATAFGITKADTLMYRIGWPINNYAIVGGGVDIYIGTGGLINFPVQTVRSTYGIGPADTIDFIFDDAALPHLVPANTFAEFNNPAFISPLTCTGSFFAPGANCAAAGNIMLTGDTINALRVFTAPGTYVWHSVRLGSQGRIIVVDER